jgi:glycerophosphoryl diester phosphodiesterase
MDGGPADTLRRGGGGPSPWTAGFDIDAVGGSTPRLVSTAGCQVWSPLFRDVTPEALAESKSLGIKVIPWTVNERAEMARLIGLGVDGIITDYPDRLRAVMAEKDMPLPPPVPDR